jgi:hypothetical protein
MDAVKKMLLGNLALPRFPVDWGEAQDLRFCQTGNSDYTSQGLLNWLAGSLAMPSLPAVWLALFTTAPTDAGTGGTEVSGGAYARQQVGGTATTNNTTASGNATLHFAATPSWIVAGMSIRDVTSASVIPASTTVLSTTGTTVVMSANATGAGVGNGDSIAFSAFAAATGSAPSTATSNAITTFPTATANWGTVLAWGLYDAVSSGNLLAWDYLGNYAWLPCTISSASPGVFTAHAHGYSVNDNVIYSTEYGGTAPTFSQSNLTGIVQLAHAATDTFDVTNAATAVNTSSTGNGLVRKVTEQSVPSGVQASFASGALVLTQA